MDENGTVLITGGAGFIGARLTGRLLEKGYRVVCIDNLSLGRAENIAVFSENRGFVFREGDASSIETLIEAAERFRVKHIFHLAANSDIQLSSRRPEIDYQNTFLTTYAVLECMRRKNIRRLFFSSTSAVYGDQEGVLLSEQSGSLAPVSYYGGAKLASEAFISSYAHMNDFDVTVFRFPNVIGPGLTHGVLFDFIKKLRRNSHELEILGDGTQNKPYIYIDDLLDAIALIALNEESGFAVYNAGVEGTTSVRTIADMVCAKLNLSGVQYRFTGGSRGWKGDVPNFQYDLSKIHARGWRAAYNSTQAVEKTLEAVLGENRT